MIITSVYLFLNLKLTEINDFINNTIIEHIKKYGDDHCRKIEFKNKNISFEKIKNKTKNITSNCGIKKTIIATQGRYEYIKANKLIILIEGSISRNVTKTYKKCNNNISRLWRIFFTKIANNSDYVYNYCNGPHNSFQRHCVKWYIYNSVKNNSVTDDDYNFVNNFNFQVTEIVFDMSYFSLYTKEDEIN